MTPKKSKIVGVDKSQYLNYLKKAEKFYRVFTKNDAIEIMKQSERFFLWGKGELVGI
jgi:hypothetical protein